MDTKATATLTNGQKVKGRLTTDHAASSYNQPVFVDEDNQAYNWAEIADIATTSDRSKGGKSTSEAKGEAARLNGRKGGRPKKQ
jgi:hypothetical protein